MDLGSGSDGRTAGFRGILLFDRDGRADALDRIDCGFLHPLEELLGVRGKGFHVAPLAFGVERVEGERRLAGSARTGEHDERAARQFEIQPLQVVLPSVTNDDAIFHDAIEIIR